MAKKRTVVKRKQRQRELAMRLPNASQRYRLLHIDPKAVEAMCEQHLKTVVRRIGDGKKMTSTSPKSVEGERSGSNK
jgi:hypothetical protein